MQAQRDVGEQLPPRLKLVRRCDHRKHHLEVSTHSGTSQRAELNGKGGYHYPAHQTPWQEMQREIVDQFSEGMVLKPAVKYRDVAHTSGVPRDNH